MTIPIVKTAIESVDELDIIDVLKLSFVADPAIRWVWPDLQKYFLHIFNFAKAFVGKAFSHESAHYIVNYSGAALWLPPNVHPDVDGLIALLQSSGSEDSKKDGPEVFEKMNRYHPNEPHWYLPLLEVDSLHHGKGLDSALMQHAIVMLDLDNKLVYLELSNPKNIPFYGRHGFKLLDTI